MDDFAFDLDKALDELEEEEVTEERFGGCHSNPTLSDQLSEWDHQATPGSILPNREPNNGTVGVCNGSHEYRDQKHEPGLLYEPPLNLDLDEADFAPSINIKPQRTCVDGSEMQNGVTGQVGPPAGFSSAVHDVEHAVEPTTGSVDKTAGGSEISGNSVENDHDMNGTTDPTGMTEGQCAVDSQSALTLDSNTTMSLPDVINSECCSPAVADTCSNSSDQRGSVDEQSDITVSVSDATNPAPENSDVTLENISQNSEDLQDEPVKHGSDAEAEMSQDSQDASNVLQNSAEPDTIPTEESDENTDSPSDVQISAKAEVMEPSQLSSTGDSTAPSQLSSTGDSTALSQLFSMEDSTAPSQLSSTGDSTAPSQLSSMEDSMAPSQLSSMEDSTAPSQLSSTGDSTAPSQFSSTGDSTTPSQLSSAGDLTAQSPLSLPVCCGSKADSDVMEAVDTEEVDVVGFYDNTQVDLDLSNDEMEQYLSTIGGPDNYSEFDAKPSLAEEIAVHRSPAYSEGGQAVFPGLSLFGGESNSEAVDLNGVDSNNAPPDSGTDQLDSPTDQLEVPEDLEERRDSGGSVEKFLVPAVMSPGISTPIEDPGYSKVPGYMPELTDTIEEETEEDIDMDRTTSDTVEAPATITDSHPASPSHTDTPEPCVQTVSSPDLGGARPKEQVKISRPNSLLGLSTPDLPSLTPPHSAGPLSTTARDSGIIEDFRSPTDPDGDITPNTESSSNRSMNDIINMQLAAQKPTPLMKKQMNLAIKQQILPEPGVTDSGDTSQADSSTQVGEFCPPAPRPSTLGSDQTGLPNKPVHTLPSPTTHVPVVSALPSGESDTHTAMGVDNMSAVAVPMDTAAGSSPRQKRPTSLSIVPRTGTEAGSTADGTPSPAYDERDVDETEAAMDGLQDTGAAEPRIGDIDNMSGAESPLEGAQPQVLDPSVGAVGPVPSAVAEDANPPPSANINLAITQLGKVPPVWVPDTEAAACMQCEARFTFTKRRHHCRACGKVFCNSCCNLRSRIQHIGNKEARVCSKCYQDLIRAQVYERMHHPGPRPNPNNPSEYCSTLPPMQQAAGGLNASPPTVMVPVGVLRKEGVQRRSEGPKQVMFSDGIRPGGDLTELDGSDQRIPPQRSGRRTRRMEKADGDGAAKSRGSRELRKNVCLIPDQGLPPVLLSTGVKGDFSIEENPDTEQILPRIRSTDDPEPVVFAINKNLFVLVKIVNLDCCVNRVCWCFTTKGMCTAGQDEIVIVLECLPDEKTIPKDIFCHLNAVYEEASKGNTVSHLGHTIFAQGFLDSRDHSGFLYINATYQCLQKLILPPQPYIFGILLQKWETPWAKVFPVRLLLRLGAEYRYYPCPLISVRFRKPVYGEIGHTIMNLLADFRNYQYMLPQVPGVTVHMEDKHTTISFPRNRYNNIMKVLTNSNDHVMALGANFSLKADSHLVCLQNEEGTYQTQAINIQNKPRKITGASFVVFNGAFKQSSGLRAKSSIVEDGLMVQITAEVMAELKDALRNMEDFVIGCGSLEAPQPEEVVTVQWIEDDTYVNIGVISPVDQMTMDGVPSIRIHNSTDFVGEKHTVRWTEVFFIKTQTDGNARSEPVDLSRLAESLAQATCGALTPLLEKLQEAHLTKIGLRATIDPDKVCYEVGSGGSKLPDTYMDALDSALIPVIHSAATQNQDGPVVLELLFHIIE